MTTKSDIVKKIVEKYPLLGKEVVIAIIDRFFEVLLDELKNHNRIELRGFASFSIRSYNLSESEISDKFTKSKYFKVYFRSSKTLSNLVNNSNVEDY
ncbi:HU family DNA-binding protein [Wolbachia endosymbiont of Chironomus riparius]|uniref:HU family DNA-binding protein n=1 Tax=Wolbachia endosymbiont of Chironomus riparius TaxID=2883238 RepID=UPI00209D1207|nr:HU family DNA-binding protein [Wolbachia endosymbiont of Chironomus riparius]